MIDTYTFPPILLVVQFHGGAIRRCDEIRCGIPREATQVSLLVLSKESDVSQFSFLSLLGIVASPLSGVFANA